MSEEYTKPLPDVDAETHAKPFWEGAHREELRFQECQSCGERQFPPRPLCRNCGTDEFEWLESDGVGSLYGFTIVRRAVRCPEFAEEIPYGVGYIDLEEGIRMFSRIEGDVDELERGIPVEVTFDHVTDEVTLPKFRPR